MKRTLLSLTLAISCVANAQLITDTLAIQDFEVIPMTPTWTFTGPVVYRSGFTSATAGPPNSPVGIGGSRAWETTTNSAGLILEFANVTVTPGYDSVRVKFRLAAMDTGGTSSGPDDLDYMLTEVSLDGGSTYYQRLRIRGAVTNNCYWPYSATGVAKVYYQPQTEQMFQPATSGPQTTMGYSTCEITFPGTVTQVRIKMTGRSSSASDTWFVDNLLITGEYVSSASVENTFNVSDIIVSPNPSDGIFTITNQNASLPIEKIVVMDLSGKEIKEIVHNDRGSMALIDLPCLAPGLYLLKVSSGVQYTFVKIALTKN